MNLHLAQISRQVAPGAHAVITLDDAGWRQPGGQLCVPKNVSLLTLPPYWPELNPVENVWQFLRQNHLSNRVYEKPTRLSSMPAAPHGTRSSQNPPALPRSPHANGRRSMIEAVKIMPRPPERCRAAARMCRYNPGRAASPQRFVDVGDADLEQRCHLAYRPPLIHRRQHTIPKVPRLRLTKPPTHHPSPDHLGAA